MNKQGEIMGLEKIAEPSYEEMCQHPEHNPPMHISLTAGKYRYTCPGCGKVSEFLVPLVC